VTDDPARSAYAAGLAMLARRELSERQLRERLARREHGAAAVDEAVGRLQATGALDDRRVAMAIARTEAHVRSRGRARALGRIRAAGIGSEIAEAAVGEVFGSLDEAALLEHALSRRLRGPSPRIRDASHYRRLHQQLIRQGFSPSDVSRALRNRFKDWQPGEPGEEQG
jgi:regulatory protein